MSLAEKQTSNSQQAGAATTPVSAESSSVRYHRPRYRVLDQETGFVVEVEAPGAAKDGVSVTLEEGVLEIVAERAEQLDSQWRPVGGRQDGSSAYRLRLAIGDELDTEAIAATAVNGLVRIVLPRSEAAKPRRIAVN